MNKKGFTLIEILGIVVILGILLLIITPPILNRINSKGDEVNDLQESMIKEAAILYVEDNKLTLPQTIPASTLENKGYLKKDLIYIKDSSKKVGNITVSKTNNKYIVNIAYIEKS